MSVHAHFSRAYADALSEHILAGDERTLRAGYELGRRAVSDGVSVLDLATIHHDALEGALRAGEPLSVVRVAAADFLRETLSAYEMLHRGFGEATAAAAAERRQAAMVRQLSSFLADASLSARDPDALVEVLHLVAEHSRELTGAAYCVATRGAGTERVRARSYEDGELDAAESATLLEHVERVGAALPRRLSRSAWSDEPSLRSAPNSRGQTPSVLTVPITALDGRPIGQLQLVDKRGGDFTGTDEAIAVHFAQMTAATLERAEFYGRAAAHALVRWARRSSPGEPASG